MKLSIIIVNYNVKYFLEQCLCSVRAAIAGMEAEVLVVDNHSADGSVEYLRPRFPEVTFIENKDNPGFAKANNQAIRISSGEYVLLLNPDTVIGEESVRSLCFFMDEHPEAGGIGVKMLDGHGVFLAESKRSFPSPWVSFCKIFGLSKLFPSSRLFARYSLPYLNKEKQHKVEVLAGAFMFLRRKALDKVGLLDESFFMYGEDIDLSYRIVQGGYVNYYIPERILHYKGESTVRDGTYMKRFREAMQFFYKKHFKKSWFFDVMMQVGSFVFSLLKKNQQKNEVRIIEEYVIFSKGNLRLNLPQKTTYLSDFNQFVNQQQKNIEIIFDTTTFSFAEIITFMQLNKSKNLSFKNYISSSNYLIGSNNSNDRGQIILL